MRLPPQSALEETARKARAHWQLRGLRWVPFPWEWCYSSWDLRMQHSIQSTLLTPHEKHANSTFMRNCRQLQYSAELYSCFSSRRVWVNGMERNATPWLAYCMSKRASGHSTRKRIKLGNARGGEERRVRRGSTRIRRVRALQCTALSTHA